MKVLKSVMYCGGLPKFYFFSNKSQTQVFVAKYSTRNSMLSSVILLHLHLLCALDNTTSPCTSLTLAAGETNFANVVTSLITVHVEAGCLSLHRRLLHVHVYPFRYRNVQ